LRVRPWFFGRRRLKARGRRGQERAAPGEDRRPKEQALKADLPDAATGAIIEAMTSHGDMAKRLLSDGDAMVTFLGLLYDLLKRSDTGSLVAGNEFPGKRP